MADRIARTGGQIEAVQRAQRQASREGVSKKEGAMSGQRGSGERSEESSGWYEGDGGDGLPQQSTHNMRGAAGA